jgi:hypothetical protein
MKQQKVIVTHSPQGTDPKMSVYTVEKVFNRLDPQPGDILTVNELRDLVDNRHVEVEIKAKK